MENNDLNNLKKEHKEKLAEIQKKYAKKITIEELNDEIKKENLIFILNNNIAEIEGKTQKLAKKFHKFSKKMDGKNPEVQSQAVLNFVEENINQYWENYLFNKISFFREAKKELPINIYTTYVFGFFVTLHAKVINKSRKVETLAKGIAEMKINTDRIKAASKEFDEYLLNKESNDES